LNCSKIVSDELLKLKKMVSSYNLQPIQFNNQGLEKKNTFTFVKRQKQFEKQENI
jgi:hypothetical protein